MAIKHPVKPVPYTPTVETPEKDEQETVQGMIDTMRSIQDTTYKDGGHAMRSVHAKNDGILTGTFEVLPNPSSFGQSLFAQPATYKAVIRLSTSPGDILPDSVSTPRGFALKVYDVQGDPLPDAEPGIQDFLMVNAPAFQTPTAKKFLSSLKLLAPTTDKVPGLKQALASTLQIAEKAVEALGTKSATFISMGGHPETHPLGETFFSTTAYLYGAYMAKFSVVPVSPSLKALTNAPVDMKDRPNALRDEVRAYFGTHDAVWEFRVQLCTDLKSMPIEDPSVQWPEDQSPYVTVARLTVPRGGMLDEASAEKMQDGLTYSPWHGLAAHRPLGSINRVRKPVYEAIQHFRTEHNGCPMHGGASKDATLKGHVVL